MRTIAPAVTLLIALASASCDPATIAPPVAAVLELVSEDGQSGAAGAPLGAPIVARVLDEDDGPVPDYSVFFSADAGSFSPVTATTGEDGRAQAVWTLGTTAGAQAAELHAPALAPVAVSATALPGPVARVDASREELHFVTVGDTTHLTAAAADAYGNAVGDVVFDWSTVDAAIATVEAGVVTAVASGATRILVVAGEVGDSLEVYVIQAPASIEIDVEAATLNALGDTLRLTATVRDSAGVVIAGAMPAWTSTDEAVATVDGEGRVVSLGVGETTILVSAGGVIAVAGVGVRQIAAALTLLPAADTVAFTGSLQLVVSASDSNGVAIAEPLVAWGTTSPGDVSVSATGSLTGVGLGAARVHATMNGVSDTADILVSPVPESSAAVGARHACALDVDGVAYCWGDNSAGQLGDGTTTTRNHPAPVADNHRFVRIATMWERTCGQSDMGLLYCWGTSGWPATPTLVNGNAYRAFAVGSAHACGLLASGEAQCWGLNNNGQLGDGTTTSRNDAMPVAGGLVFDTITAGGLHSCGLVGTVAYCWGANGIGQTGDGTTTTPRTTPVLVADGHEFVSLAAGGFHTCGSAGTGLAYCWGAGSSGQLGNGTSGASIVPDLVDGELRSDLTRPGEQGTCALVGGTAYCWGRNHHGQIGDGTATNRATPTMVGGGTDFALVDTGDEIACGTSRSGTLLCWGRAAFVGHGATGTEDPVDPAPIAGDLALVEVGLTRSSSCGRTADGSTYCWGENGQGQLGNGGTEDSAVPVVIPDLWLARVSAGGDSGCGLTAFGAPYCWGRNTSGQLGNGTTTSSADPAPVGRGLVLSDITVGAAHACGIDAADGRAYCWGSNLHGQVGDSTTTNREDPTAVVGGHVFADLRAGGSHTCGIVTTGETYCWGNNTDGQTGISNGTVTSVIAPSPVSGGHSFTSLAPGSSHTCAIDMADEAYCWGRNTSGQIGVPASSFDALAPTAVGGGLTFLSITAGDSHTCGIATGPSAYCWGANASKQLGTGNTTSSSEPVPVIGGHAFTSVDAATTHTCAVDGSGVGYCWGAPATGQLGAGNTWMMLTPTPVLNGPVLPPN